MTDEQQPIPLGGEAELVEETNWLEGSRAQVVPDEPKGETSEKSEQEKPEQSETPDGTTASQEPDKQEPEVEPNETPEVDWKKRYENLDSLYARQANELGSLRKEVRELKEMQSSRPVQTPRYDDTEPDDINDPQVRAKLAGELKAEILEEVRGTRTKEEGERRLNELHPDRQEITATKEFRDWMGGLPESIAKAGATDPYAAADLLTRYKNEKSLAKTTSSTKVKRADPAAAASIGDSTSGEEPVKPKFTERQIRDWIANDPRKYERMQGQIQQAYMEGRVSP